MGTPHRNVLLFGGSGQIGEAVRLCSPTHRSIAKLRTVPWASFMQESIYRNPVELRARLGEATWPWTSFDIIFANGVTDPMASQEQLACSNIQFPLSVIEATRHCSGIRYLTIGTVFEEFPAFASANRYICSKRELSKRLLSQTHLVQERRVLHLRLHTIYGGRPKPYMFLGQMIQALRDGTEFRMSAGDQLREYHHAHDIAGAIEALLGQGWEFGGEPLELNSGAPVRLVDLANIVFEKFGRLELLRIGAIAGAIGENRDRVFRRSDPAVLPYYRDPILGVLEYVRFWAS